MPKIYMLISFVFIIPLHPMNEHYKLEKSHERLLISSERLLISSGGLTILDNNFAYLNINKTFLSIRKLENLEGATSCAIGNGLIKKEELKSIKHIRIKESQVSSIAWINKLFPFLEELTIQNNTITDFDAKINSSIKMVIENNAISQKASEKLASLKKSAEELALLGELALEDIFIEKNNQKTVLEDKQKKN